MGKLSCYINNISLYYSPQTMKLKWVDDTHALAIYTSIADGNN